MGHVTATRPLERIAIDILGPLPESDSGNNCIMIVGDYFTKWSEAYPLPNQRAETVALHLVNHFISRFGIPDKIHMDQAANFEGKLFAELCRLLEIHKTRTTPWHPQSDGMIERFNRTLETMLRQVTEEDQKNWDQYLSLLSMAYRSSVNTTTGQTPNKLMFGRELPFPTHILFNETQTQGHTPYTCQYISDLQNKLKKCHELARIHADKQFKFQKREHDKNSWKRDIQKDQAVWLYNPTKRPGRSPKLQVFWEEEPYIVQDVISDHIVQIQKKGAKRPRIVHVDYIRPVVGKADLSWILQPDEDQNKEEVMAQELSPLESIGILPRRSRRLQQLPPM